MRLASISRGWPLSTAPDAINPTPDGVGVKGGGLLGDSEEAALRPFGKGVDGSSGMAKGSSGALMMVPFASSSTSVDWDGDVAGLLLRFFDAEAGLLIFSYFAAPFGAFAEGVLAVLLLATRAERLSDMLRWVGGVVLVKEAI